MAVGFGGPLVGGFEIAVREWGVMVQQRNTATATSATAHPNSRSRQELAGCCVAAGPLAPWGHARARPLRGLVGQLRWRRPRLGPPLPGFTRVARLLGEAIDLAHAEASIGANVVRAGSLLLAQMSGRKILGSCALALHRRWPVQSVEQVRYCVTQRLFL